MIPVTKTILRHVPEGGVFFSRDPNDDRTGCFTPPCCYMVDRTGFSAHGLKRVVWRLDSMVSTKKPVIV